MLQHNKRVAGRSVYAKHNLRILRRGTTRVKDTAGPRAGKGEKWEKHGCVAPIGIATIPAHAGCLTYCIASLTARTGRSTGEPQHGREETRQASGANRQAAMADRAAGGGDGLGPGRCPPTRVSRRSGRAQDRSDGLHGSGSGVLRWPAPLRGQQSAGMDLSLSAALGHASGPAPSAGGAGPSDRLVLPESLVLLGVLAGVPSHRGDRVPVGPDCGRRLGALAGLARHGGGPDRAAAHAQLFAARAGGSRQAVPLAAGVAADPGAEKGQTPLSRPLRSGGRCAQMGPVPFSAPWLSWTAGGVVLALPVG